MKAAVLMGKQALAVQDVPEPQAGPGEVIIRVELCGICGSDLHLYSSDMAEAAVGTVMGHEYSGEIVQLGPEVEGWSVGDRVVASMPPPCLTCPFCLRGLTELCYAQHRLGAQTSRRGLAGGGYAPYTRVAASRLVRVPDDVTAKEAATIEPLAVGLHAVRKSSLLPGDRVVVLGAGPIGLFTLSCILAAGPRRVAVVEPVALRAAKAKELGADAVWDPLSSDVTALVQDMTDGQGADVVFDCAGVTTTVQQAVGLVRRAGKVIIVGAAFSRVPVRPSVWVTKQVTVRACYAYTYDEYPMAIEMIRRRTAPVASIVSDIVPLSHINTVFTELLAPQKHLKVLIDPHQHEANI